MMYKTKIQHVTLILFAFLLMIVSSVIVSAAEGEYLILKQNIDIGNIDSKQILPVMGDIDNDGTQEIVMATGNGVVVVDGKTGAIEWTLPESTLSQVELVDLDNDGTPEILQGIDEPARIRAINGDGTIRWVTQVSGNSQAMFPIVAFDIDGDGYPAIYFATEDTYPRLFTGSLDDYDGALTMLDHNGNILRSTWLYHPCWGGLALGDYNFDGKFEVYVGDRRYNYNNVPAKGIQAYDAETLDLLWNRGDIFHSSPTAVLADVTGDENLEIIAQKIVHGGVAVLDGATGQTIPGFDYLNANLPTHAAGTVYDIDLDGNLEIINAVHDNTNYPKDFTVFDLVTGEEDFHPYFDFWLAWPPEVGDVTGNGEMEILAAAGNQGSLAGDYPLLIYDKDFNLIQNLSITGAGQLMPARVFDCDSDGLNEVVVVGVRGTLLVYDTLAPTPNPAPRTWIQRYSEYRQGAAEYVAPPGPAAPVIKNELPFDGSLNIPSGPVLSIWTNDFQNDLIDITFEVNDGSGWQIVNSYTDVGRGTYTADTAGYVEDSDKDYEWRVTTDDGQGHVNQKTFTFSTTPGASWAMPGWSYRKQIVIDHTLVTDDLTGFPALIEFTDANVGIHTQTNGEDILFTSVDGATKISHEIEAYTSADGHLIAWVKTDLSSTQDTIIYMYYGNLAATNQEDSENVWDSNYLAIHHLEETSGTVEDSTSYINDGTSENGVTQDVSGKVDGADQFDGVDDRTQLPQIYSDQTQFTVEGWFSTEPKQGYIISQWDGLENQGMLVQYFTDGTLQFYVDNVSIGRPTFTGGSWHYFAGVFDGTTMLLYTDNNIPATGTSTVTWPTLNAYLGDRTSGGRALQGILDEIRISDVARSEAYIQTSYNNQNDPAAFTRIGAEQENIIICTDSDLDGYSNFDEFNCGPIDCDDTNPTINPGATEICNDVDDNCNAQIDEGVKNIYYGDFDLDTYGNPAVSIYECTAPANYVTDYTDCNDNSAEAYPGGIEICDGLDNDCDGVRDGFETRDELCPVLDYYCDVDIDTYFSSIISGSCTRFNCTPDACTLIQGNDCDDADIAINPVAEDSICNGIDENCDGTADDAYVPIPTSCGIGACGATGTLECIAGIETNICAPGTPATEVCEGSIDENCDGLLDEGCSCTLGDTQVCGSDVGECQIGLQSCQEDETWSIECLGGIVPATEICDGLDNDCDGIIDEDVTITYYEDADSDTYGNLASTTQACTAPTGYVDHNTDCNDNNANINPAASDDNCNGVDDNCNMQIDEDYVSTPTVCTEGQCADNGQLICIDGVEHDTCYPLSDECIYSCGDGTCNGEETCSSCLTDCGTCPAEPEPEPEPTSTRSSGGGGGGGGGTILWECTEWSVCTNGKQSQTCTYRSISKTNTQKCVAEISEPSGEESTLVSTESAPSEEEESSANTNVESGETAAEEELEASKENNEITGLVTGNEPKGKVNWLYPVLIVVFIAGLLFAVYFYRKNKK